MILYDFLHVLNWKVKKKSEKSELSDGVYSGRDPHQVATVSTAPRGSEVCVGGGGGESGV